MVTVLLILVAVVLFGAVAGLVIGAFQGDTLCLINWFCGNTGAVAGFLAEVLTEIVKNLNE